MYKYSYDETRAGNYRLSRDDYALLQEALKILESKLSHWNTMALKHGAIDAPYEREVEDLRHMITWGEEQLGKAGTSPIRVDGIAVGSLVYQKAALVHAAWAAEKEISQKHDGTWPGAVLDAMRGKVRRYQQLAEDIPHPPSAILDELRPEYEGADPRPEDGTDKRRLEQVSNEPSGEPEVVWDVFISHASEDKEQFVRPLAEALQQAGLKVWYDELTLTVGDSLRRSIDRGLARSRFGIVVLSPRFMAKEWTQKELDGLVAREVDGQKVILPVWHEIDAPAIRRFSPLLADRVAVKSSAGMQYVVEELLRAMGVTAPEGQTRPVLSNGTTNQGGMLQDAEELLLAASDAKDGAVMAINMLAGLMLQANQRDFVETGNARSEARGRAALQKLAAAGLIEQTDSKGEIFSVTAKGYEAADGLRAKIKP